MTISLVDLMHVAEMLANIEHCINEEVAAKVANVRSKYKEWWLVLTDQMLFRARRLRQATVARHAKRPAGWDKIVVVSLAGPYPMD